MSDPAEATLVFELADAVSALTRRQSELLQCLETFRKDFFRFPVSVGTYQPPPPRFVRPPVPPMAPPAPPPVVPRYPEPRSRVIPATPHLPAADRPAPAVAPSPAPAVAPPAAIPSAPPVALRPTKRDYDYFAELDDLLARLPVEPTTQEPGPPTGEAN